jgi:hypothetical protein
VNVSTAALNGKFRSAWTSTKTRSRPRSRTAFSRSFCRRPSERRRRQNESPSTAQPNTDANRLEMERSRRLEEAAGMAYESLVFKRSGHWRTVKVPSAHVALCRAKTRGLPTRHHRSGALAISRSKWIKIERTIQICMKKFSEWFGSKRNYTKDTKHRRSSPSEKFGGRALEKMSGQRSTARARRSREQSSFTRSSRMDFILSSRQRRKRNWGVGSFDRVPASSSRDRSWSFVVAARPTYQQYDMVLGSTQCKETCGERI